MLKNRKELVYIPLDSHGTMRRPRENNYERDKAVNEEKITR